MSLLRTILRRLFFTATAFLTLCGIATAGLWIWTNSAAPFYHLFESTPIFGKLSFTANSHFFGMDYDSSQLIIEPPIDPPDGPIPRPSIQRFHIGIPYPNPHLGFHIGSVRTVSSVLYDLTSNQTRYATSHFFLAPYWVCIPMVLAFPLLLLSRRRRKSTRPGLCPKCSYDLRAHTPGSLCPECGTPISGADATVGKSQV